jgi:hypothetical protein
LIFILTSTDSSPSLPRAHHPFKQSNPRDKTSNIHPMLVITLPICTHIMELDTVMQIVFGTFTISIAVFGIWLAWHTTRGKLSCSLLGSYPMIPPHQLITDTPRARNALLPSHHDHASPEGRYVWAQRHETVVHYTFGHFASPNHCPYLSTPTAQQPGRIFDNVDRR